MPMQRPASPTSRTPMPQPVQSIDFGKEKSGAAKPEGMTEKQRQMIAIGGLAVCLLVGAGIVYWLLWGAGPKHRTITVDPAKQTAGMSRGQINFTPPRPRQAITKEGNDQWRATGMNCYMVVRNQGGKEPTLAMRYERRDFLNPQQISLVSGAFRATIDQAMAKEWGVTADQVEKIKAVKLGTPPIVISDGERKEMQQLWATYSKAADGSAKSDAEKAVIKRLEELAKAHLDESRKAYTAKVDELKSIFSAEQVGKIAK